MFTNSRDFSIYSMVLTSFLATIAAEQTTPTNATDSSTRENNAVIATSIVLTTFVVMGTLGTCWLLLNRESISKFLRESLPCSRGRNQTQINLGDYGSTSETSIDINEDMSSGYQVTETTVCPGTSADTSRRNTMNI